MVDLVDGFFIGVGVNHGGCDGTLRIGVGSEYRKAAKPLNTNRPRCPGGPPIRL
jgi:hypothetical protein